MCRRPGDLNIHHITYDLLGYEFDTDLIVLCHFILAALQCLANASIPFFVLVPLACGLNYAIRVGNAPAQVMTDGHAVDPRAICEALGGGTAHRCSRYKNHRIE